MTRLRLIRKLKEMAYEKKSIQNKILNTTNIVNEHLFKLILFPQLTQEHNGWKESVAKSFNDVSRMYWSGNNFYLKQSFYFENYYSKPLEPFDKIATSYLKDLQQDYSNYDLNFTKQNFPYDIYQKKFKEFFSEVSSWLSKGLYDKVKLYNLIDKIFIEKFTS